MAAALAYCYDDDRDPLTIMTYDLGGGTFDVAIIRKQEGVFDVKAFDGDSNLGGCDFDKRLAYWITDQLGIQGYQLDINKESPEFNKLMVLAENAKAKLSDHEVWEIVEQNTGIIDANGEPVSIDMEITRETYENLIRDYIEETIRLCRKAMEKSEPPVEPQTIDEIVMVGGSSRIPLIAHVLEHEFGCKPRLDEPDLSVAIGAAIMARQLGTRTGILRLDHLSETTSLSAIQITGTLEPGEQVPEINGYTVVLIPGDDSLPQRITVGDKRGFVFPQVPLAADTANRFSLRIEDINGNEVLTHDFTIQRETSAHTPVSSLAGFEANILAKPISIMTVSGLHTVAAERTSLPFECHVDAQTMDQKGEIRIPVYEDARQIGEIVVESVPTDLPVGSSVEITLTLRRDFYIDGKARIPGAEAEGQVTIQIPPVAVKGINELQEDYFKLNRQANESLAQADRGQAFGIAPRLKDALAACKKLLYEERDPNLAKAQELLAEVETLIRQLGSWQPNPSLDQFEQVKQEIESELLPDLYAMKPAAKGSYDGQFKAVVQMCEKAATDKNEMSWADTNRRLDDLRDRIISELNQEERRHQRQTGRTDKSKEEPPDPRSIKLKLGLDITQLREEARQRGRLLEFEADFVACEQVLKSIDAGASDALGRLIEYYENLHQPLQARVISRKAGNTSLPEKFVRVLSDHKSRV